VNSFYSYDSDERFIVRKSGPLEGVVRVGGAKNSVLKLMAACLLAEGTYVLSNVPDISDVEIMSEVLESVGAKVARTDRHELTVWTPKDIACEIPYELVDKMRASVVVLGPLLARLGRARVSMPGGDDFGHRPIDIHLDGLSAMGAKFSVTHGYVEGVVDGADGLHGAQVLLEFPSHTATENLLMAATLANGTTVIDNAAREPEVADLATFLIGMGARIEGAGTSRIVVEGVRYLHQSEHRVMPDRVEAATFLAAVGLAKGEVLVEEARADHMSMLLQKLRDMSVEVEVVPRGLLVRRTSERLRSVDVATLPYPGVATDYMPFLVTMLSVADGVGIVTENLFSGRFRYVDELRRMGADIRIRGHHAVVRGQQSLSGAPVRAPDIRAGAALVLAGLVAEGETNVSGVYHIDRGYEDFAAKLSSIGADVLRCDQPVD